MEQKISEEVLAAIAAAVSQMEAKPGHKLVVRSMKRIPQHSPVWNTTGRAERMRRNLNA